MLVLLVAVLTLLVTVLALVGWLTGLVLSSASLKLGIWQWHRGRKARCLLAFEATFSVECKKMAWDVAAPFSFVNAPISAKIETASSAMVSCPDPKTDSDGHGRRSTRTYCT